MSARFALEGGDAFAFMITCIAAGQQVPGITVDDCVGVLTAFIDGCKSTLSDDPHKAAHRVYADIQQTLMAIRKDDFITIQKEPPFSKQGKANFISLLTAYNGGGKERLSDALEKVIKLGSKSSFNEDPIKYSGGSGLSMRDAVVILSSDKNLGVAAEYWYLCYTYGRIEKKGQSLHHAPDGKHYDCVSFTTPGGENKFVYFDITAFYN